MDIIKIIGNRRPLFGQVRISGAKNAALPIMAASLLTDDTVVLTNIPNLSDIVTMSQLLINHGASICIDGANINESTNGRTILLNASNINNFVAPYDIVRRMRASFLVLGPILTRFGRIEVSLPGGCAIGSRPVNLHLEAMEQMGAEIKLQDGYIIAEAPNGLHGCTINFDIISVGATENVLMAASLANGITIVNNAAVEPEVTDLAKFLVKMGAKIEGIGTSSLKIEGVKKLHGAHYSIIADRIEAASYAVAAAVTNGEIELLNIQYSLFENIAHKFENAGLKIINNQHSITVKLDNNKIYPVDVSTMSYPGFPTDVQAQFMLMMSLADGVSAITENIWENRFMHVPELNRMGANITVNGNCAVVKGVKELKGAKVMASDLRASISLVLAGLAASGETILSRVYHLDRGYEAVEQKIFACGGSIVRLSNV